MNAPYGLVLISIVILGSAVVAVTPRWLKRHRPELYKPTLGPLTIKSFARAYAFMLLVVSMLAGTALLIMLLVG